MPSYVQLNTTMNVPVSKQPSVPSRPSYTDAWSHWDGESDHH
jgi:hypothetical protein